MQCIKSSRNIKKILRLNPNFNNEVEKLILDKLTYKDEDAMYNPLPTSQDFLFYMVKEVGLLRTTCPILLGVQSDYRSATNNSDMIEKLRIKDMTGVMNVADKEKRHQIRKKFIYSYVREKVDNLVKSESVKLDSKEYVSMNNIMESKIKKIRASIDMQNQKREILLIKLRSANPYQEGKSQEEEKQKKKNKKEEVDENVKSDLQKPNRISIINEIRYTSKAKKDLNDEISQLKDSSEFFSQDSRTLFKDSKKEFIREAKVKFRNENIRYYVLCKQMKKLYSQSIMKINRKAITGRIRNEVEKSKSKDGSKLRERTIKEKNDKLNQETEFYEGNIKRLTVNGNITIMTANSFGPEVRERVSKNVEVRNSKMQAHIDQEMSRKKNDKGSDLHRKEK